MIPVREALLRCRVQGSGPAVIVLHDGPGIGCRYLEPELSEALSDVTRTVFYDQRASGLSTGVETPSLLTMPEYVADLETVRGTLGIERPILVGHSFGGLLAMYYAIAYPDRVTSLILTDPDPASRALWSGYSERIQSRRGEDTTREIAAIQAIDNWAEDPDLIARYFELALGPYFAARISPPEFGRRFTPVIAKNLTTAAAAVRRSLGDWDIHPSLHRIQCPCLIVAGEDSIFPPESMDRLKAELPDCALVKLKYASHFPQIESPGEFREIVRGFVTAF